MNDKIKIIIDGKECITERGKTVLDIGTGTGAWAASIHKFGPSKLKAIDCSEKMLIEAKKKHPYIEFSNAYAEDLSEFDDNTFDIVTASFVLHGVVQEKRKLILKELKRVSKKHVVIRDMFGKTPGFLKFLEFLEQSDYKHFKKNFCEELKEHFEKIKAIPTKYGTGLYIAEK